jgi:hypothetical protein
MPKLAIGQTQWDLHRQISVNEANEPAYAAPLRILGKRIKKNINAFRLSTEKMSFNHIFYTSTELNDGDKITEIGQTSGHIVTADFGNGKYGLS